MNHGLSIAYMLLVADRELTTKEIIKRVGCNRKTVYKTIDEMELAGFITTKKIMEKVKDVVIHAAYVSKTYLNDTK